jgi:hypothetical protein
MKRPLTAALFIFTVCLNAAAVRGVWETKPQRLGDAGTIVLDFGKIDGNFYVEGLPAKGSDFGDLRIIDVENIRDEQGNVTARLKVIVFGTGEIKPAKLALKVLGEKGESGFDAEFDSINIQKRVTAAEQPPSIAHPIELPKPFPLVRWIIGIVSVLAAIILAVLLLRKKPSKALVNKDELSVERSPDDWLIQRLKAYVTKSLLSLKDYADISYDIRLYLEKKNEFKALESTTFELREILKVERPFRNLEIGDFVYIFSFCDFVKFAKHFPDAEEESKFKTILREYIKEVELSIREEKKAA